MGNCPREKNPVDFFWADDLHCPDLLTFVGGARYLQERKSGASRNTRPSSSPEWIISYLNRSRPYPPTRFRMLEDGGKKTWTTLGLEKVWKEMQEWVREMEVR